MADTNGKGPGNSGPKGKGGRPRLGHLYRTKDGWYRLRLTVDRDGETIQETIDLETKDDAVAKQKQRRIARSGVAPTPEQAKAAITCDDFGLPWFENRIKRGIAAATYEQRYYRQIWQPVIGKLPL